ncbi:MAG TPA: hypothetical protein VJO72_09975 [Candidatus Dormibacteraeota bacterium]|nr:hypothetical protein [Candidatus Dormibacteraeota bacterium]
MVRPRRRDLLAYLVGAGVAGTLLIGPYGLRFAVIQLIPGAAAVQPPFFLLPIVWGLWNLLWARRQPAMSVGRWGALLGLLAGVAVNLLFVAQGRWFRPAMLLPLFLALVYYLAWRVVIGPLNEALGVDGERTQV